VHIVEKTKIMTIVGTRPEIIKLSRVISQFDEHTDHTIVHTGQNYDFELNEIFFNELKIRKPDYYLDCVGKTTADTIGSIISKSDAIMRKINPDAVLLYGDTNSCLSIISAKRLKIPVFHFEAGNRCFDQRVPEELNRKVVDHLSDINFPLTEHARKYLISEGIKPETIIKVGSPMKEVLDHYMPNIVKSNILSKLSLNEFDYFLLSCHREENVDSMKNFKDLLDSLNIIAEKYDKRIIVSTHPRTSKKLSELKGKKLDDRIEFMKPMGLFDYIMLQLKSFCVISDSGTITEESSILNFPAITIRQAHERPEGMDEGTLIMSGLESKRILESIQIVTSHHDRSIRKFKLVGDYDVDNFSFKILRIVLSYIDYINRNVWRK